VSDQNPPASLPAPQQILAALDRTGFILEYRLLQSFEKLGFTSFLNHPFIDPETKTSREIDVIASASSAIETLAEDYRITIDTTIVAECKNYADPLIVIGRDEETSFHHAHPIITFDPLLFPFPDRSPEAKGALDQALSLWSLPSHNTKGFVGSQLIKMHRKNGAWQATNELVYDAIIYPLFKAVKAKKERIPPDRPGDLPHPLLAVMPPGDLSPLLIRQPPAGHQPPPRSAANPQKPTTYRVSQQILDIKVPYVNPGPRGQARCRSLPRRSLLSRPARRAAGACTARAALAGSRRPGMPRTSRQGPRRG
jgi:hypothetical protein